MTEEMKQEQPSADPNAAEPQARTPLEGFIFHQRRAAEEAVRAVDSLIPDSFKNHARESAKEWLTSFKVLVEGAASNLEQELNRMREPRQKPADKNQPKSGSGPTTTGKSKVKVEVS
jgi:hypothetical protein